MALPEKRQHNQASWLAAWGPAAIWGLVISYASAILIGPETYPFVPFGDKLFHLGEYVVFGYLLHFGAKRRSWPAGWPTWWRLLIPIVLISFINEWHQAFVPTRFPDERDMLADLIGGLVGILGFAWELRRAAQAKAVQP